VDSELSPDAMTLARVHLSECPSCRTAAEELGRLRRAVKEAVGQWDPPASLVHRVRRATSASPRRARAFIGIAAALLLASLYFLAPMSGLRLILAGGMERVAFHLDRPQTLVLEGKIVCRGCELHALYGTPDRPDAEGHHGALMTGGGKIWNFMEGEKSDRLIHDARLLGKQVRVRGRIYRRAGCLEVERYEILDAS
jgi:hypothetical protein